jgi:hypothetical protein
MKKARSRGMGKTIPAFAKFYDVPEAQVRRGVENGDVKTVPFAGLDRITPAEERRLVELFELTPVEVVEEATQPAKSVHAEV